MEPKKKFGLRRILSVVLCLSMLLSPVVTFADSVVDGGIESLAEPESILIQEAETKTVYKLVENYTLADLVNGNKTFMIVSTDVPGAASALGAKDNSGSYMQTRNDLKVFEVPVETDSLSAGKYVTNTFSTPANGEWKFESAGSGRYYLYTTSTLGDAFLSTHNNGGTGGYHSGHMMLISRENAITNKWTRVCKFAMASDNVDLSGLNTVYSSVSSEKPGGVTAGANGYLCYGEYDGYYDNVNKGKFTDFNIVTAGSAKTRVQFYEKVGSRAIPEIKGYLYSNMGTVAVNTGKFAPTGAYIHLYVDGNLTRVPITTDMLSGADLTKAGTYNNVKVNYNGVQLADNFTLEVKAAQELVANNYNEANKNSSFFVLADPDQNNSFVEGGYIHIAETQTPGYVRLLTTDGTNLGSSEYYAYEIFVDGERQLVLDAASANSIWVTTAGGHTGLPSAKFWHLRAFLYGEKYLRFNGTSDLGQGSALTVGAVDGWEALWHERGEMTGIAVYNPSGTVISSATGNDAQNHKWRTMYYNYMIGTFGLRLEQADGNAEGYKPSNQNVNELREPQPQDRAYFYTRTSEYANATVYLTKNEGTVSYGATAADSPTGVYLVMTVTDAYGASHITNIPVTLDMLSCDGDNVKTKTATESDKVYNNVKVTYQGKAISENFKVTVKQKLPENDYPKFPEPGSVEITKGLNEEYDYLATGLTEVKLTLTGIPDASGADVVLVLDNSGSMAYSADPNSDPMPNNAKARRNEMVASIKTMLKKFAETIDGYKSDISVSILTFDGYTLIDGGMFIKKSDGSSNTLASTHNQADTAHFLTPSESLATLPSIENRFIHSSELTDAKIDEIANSFGTAYSGSGTNYDQGLHLAYETLKGKQKLNAQAGTKRNPFLIFMSDGCTWQYNYVGGGSAEGYSTWDNYLNGKLSDIPAISKPSNTERYNAFANSEGKHWMAEAIKGDTDKRYKIINPSANPADNYIEWVNGLGAEVFVVGFGMAADNAISRDTAVGVLRRISSGDEATGHFYDVAKSGQINEVFNEVAMKIRAASGAVFEDKLGEAFDLQRASTVAGPRGPITLDPAPSVEVYEFITYRLDQVGTIVDNILVTEEMVGTVRKGYEDGTIIEKVTFSADGSEAYSSIKGTSTNILDKDGIINAVTFRYNTSKTETITIDSNADGILDYDLPPETFAWLVGDIPQSRYELHYDVYLEGSMEGLVEFSESQLTNEYAVLKYKNYIGNACSIEAPKPNLGWEAAKVTYAFYLTNEDGQPLNEHGQVVDFKDAKVIEVDAETLKLLLNSKDLTINGNKYLPEGYILYDYNSAYSVLAESKSIADGKWDITRTDGLIKSTYVEYGENVTTENVDSLTQDTSNVNFRNTRVWFAVIPNVAKVSYKYYVVNSAGQPVDANGNVVPLAQAQVLEGEGLSGTKDFTIGESATIVAENSNIPSMYALFDPAAEYTVSTGVESPSTGNWQIKKTSDKTPTTYVESAGTHLPTVENTTNDENANYRDTTVWFAVYHQGATVNYKYYLVNEAGQPVDAQGNVLTTYNDAVINGFGGTKNFYVNENIGVDVEDDENVANSNRYDIFDGAAYVNIYANGESENKGNWSITSNKTPLTTYVESGKISTTSDTENNVDANYRNTTVWFALKLKPAEVSYKYYLVNENGDPIDTKGNVISDFKDAQITGLGGSYTFSVDNSYTIPVGEPSSKYTVFDPDAEYTVFANGDDANKGYWTIESGKNKKTTYVVSGSVETTEATTDSANYRDTEVWFALVLPKAKVTYKYYLVNEYGKPIDATGRAIVSFKDAQIADYGSSKEFYVGNSAIIKVTDETDISTSKYTIFDKKAEYTVFAGLDSVSDGSWSIEYDSELTKTTFVESAGKHNPTTSNTSDNVNANYRDTTVWFALMLNEAKVTYKYYLVNINGEPISTSGAVLDDFEAAEIAGLGGSKEFYVDSSATVDVTDGNVPSKYEIFDPLAKYKVTASSEAKNKGSWEITVGETKKTTYVVSGSVETTENTTDGANYRNTTVWFALVPKTPVADDTVVIDYGIPVDVDVLANDNGSTLLGYTADKIEDPSLYRLFPTSQLTNFKNKTELKGEFGTFTTTANNEIRYELAEMHMTSFDRITYGANYAGNDYVNGNYYAHLTVIPATIIYFEDDFVSFTVNDYKSGNVIAEKWTTVGTEKDGVQRDDRVGELLANVYGNDAAYADSSTYSFGSAQKVTVERTDKYDENGKIINGESTGKYATATFTFVGTGFDVISYTTNKSGTIAVQVFPYASLDATEASATPIKSTVVDTYYGYKYATVPALDKNGNQLVENGKVVYEDRWVPVTSDTEDGLYQVPVIKWSGDTYGKYKVVITASYNWIFDHGQYGGSRLPNEKANATREGKYDFYLDAIRIYDPANGGEGNDVIKNAYIADGEYMPVFKELRNILIKDVKGFAANGSNVDGAVYIDNASDSAKKTYTLNEYKAYGPNNEVYLGAGQAVAFTVNTTGYASVQIAAKLAKGTGKLKITNLTNSLYKNLDIETATDLYYALDDILAENAANILVIQNVDGNGIISITNLKFAKAVATAQVQTVNAVYMNTKTAQAAVDYLNATQAEPEIYSVKSMKPSVKAGQRFTVTVTTNSDAEYIVVNGETFTKYTENKAKDQRIWKVTLTLDGKGMTQISANAYSANNVESRTVSTTVRVTKASSFSFGGIFDGFFGGLFGK